MRTPPATRVTAAGRACAKRIRTPYQCCSLLLRNDLFSMEWHSRLRYACLARYTPIQHRVQVLRHPPSYPVDGNVITPGHHRLVSLEAWSGACRRTIVTICDYWFA
jgi:hypothetical protein